MKKLRVLILSVIILIGLLFITVYGYIHLFAKDQIIHYLEKTTQEKASIAYINYAFPLGLTLKGIHFPSYGNVEKLHIFISPLTISKNRTQFNLRGKLDVYGLEVILRGDGTLQKESQTINADLTLSQRNSTNEIQTLVHIKNNELILNGEMKIISRLNKAVTETAFIQAILQNHIVSEHGMIRSQFSYQTTLDQLKTGKLKFSGQLISSETPAANSAQ